MHLNIVTHHMQDIFFFPFKRSAHHVVQSSGPQVIPLEHRDKSQSQSELFFHLLPMCWTHKAIKIIISTLSTDVDKTEKRDRRESQVHL